MPGGRPTKYKAEYCQGVIDYFKAKVANDEFPLFEDYAISLDIHRATFQVWCEKHPLFFDAYKKAKEIQESTWIKRSLEGDFNTAFTIFFGKNQYGWKDKRDIEHSGDVTIEIINYAGATTKDTDTV